MRKCDLEAQVKIAAQLVSKTFSKIRESADELELLVDDKFWSLLKYRKYFTEL